MDSRADFTSELKIKKRLIKDAFDMLTAIVNITVWAFI
jgi:hypothetical protein